MSVRCLGPVGRHGTRVMDLRGSCRAFPAEELVRRALAATYDAAGGEGGEGGEGVSISGVSMSSATGRQTVLLCQAGHRIAFARRDQEHTCAGETSVARAAEVLV